MAEQNKQQTGNREQAPANDPIHGRIHNSQNPEIEEQGSSRDISEVDQQEGNMQHGESGDRLTPPREEPQ